ncbi:MAG: CaiB/BaiF CoA transferase family protein [Alphaproteobacteria bacterium]
MHAEKPLAGLRVLDVATFIAAPFAASLLGEFGAEVIKIEQPEGGDPLRSFGTRVAADATLVWKSEARNKKSLCLDLRRPAGAALFRRLAAKSDVVCENFRPGTLERWGLGYDALSAVNPGLVLLRVSGYGQSGPYATRPGFARIAHAFGGLTHLAGMPGGPPVTPGSTSLADYMSGVFGAFGVLTALRHRERSGRGQVVDIALYESIFRVLDELAPAYALNGTVRGREGLYTISACPHGHYPTKDGKWVAIACTSDRMFERFAGLAKAHGAPPPERWHAGRERVPERDMVNAWAARFTETMNRDELIEACVAREIPCAAVSDIGDIFDDPHYAAREALRRVIDAHDGREYVVPNVVPRLSETPGSIETLGPSLNEHADYVLRELLGLSDDEIAEAERAGALRSARLAE